MNKAKIFLPPSQPAQLSPTPLSSPARPQPNSSLALPPSHFPGPKHISAQLPSPARAPSPPLSFTSS